MLKLNDPTLLKTQNYIDGEWVVGGAGVIKVSNPANGEIVATTANGDAADATRAVEAALRHSRPGAEFRPSNALSCCATGSIC